MVITAFDRAPEEATAMIRTSYDPIADVMQFHFGPPGACLESEEVAPGVILDFDAKGNVIGVEVLDVRKRASGAYSAQVARPAAAE
jgi:uncharacterized protein YuzE